MFIHSFCPWFIAWLTCMFTADTHGLSPEMHHEATTHLQDRRGGASHPFPQVWGVWGQHTGGCPSWALTVPVVTTGSLTHPWRAQICFSTSASSFPLYSEISEQTKLNVHIFWILKESDRKLKCLHPWPHLNLLRSRVSRCYRSLFWRTGHRGLQRLSERQCWDSAHTSMVCRQLAGRPAMRAASCSLFPCLSSVPFEPHPLFPSSQMCLPHQSYQHYSLLQRLLTSFCPQNMFFPPVPIYQKWPTLSNRRKRHNKTLFDKLIGQLSKLLY